MNSFPLGLLWQEILDGQMNSFRLGQLCLPMNADLWKEVFLFLARGQACLFKILQLQLLYFSYFDGKNPCGVFFEHHKVVVSHFLKHGVL